MGPMSLGADAAPIPLGGPKQRAVLAKLALTLGQAVSAEELIELVWPDSVRPAQPRRTLQVYIANLRKLLRLRALDIAGSGSAYRLVADRASVDVTVFHDLVAEAASWSEDDPLAALAAYEAAEGLWRGRALTDVVTEISGLEAAAQRLDDERVQASEQRLGLAVRHGDVAAAVIELQALVDAEPWRELAAVHLMLGLYRQGRQADALAVAATTRRRLVDDLGLDPSHALRAAEQP
jgi:DNA-binding SARP family transcriptional activator